MRSCGRSIESYGGSIQSGGRPIESNCRSIGLNGRSIELGGGSIESGGGSIESGGRSIEPGGRSAKPDGRSIESSGKSIQYCQSLIDAYRGTTAASHNAIHSDKLHSRFTSPTHDFSSVWVEPAHRQAWNLSRSNSRPRMLRCAGTRLVLDGVFNSRCPVTRPIPAHRQAWPTHRRPCRPLPVTGTTSTPTVSLPQ